MSEDFCLSFFFAEDEALQGYNAAHMASAKPQDQQRWNCKGEDGLYGIGCIWTLADTRISTLDWLDGQQELVPVTFTAATSDLSDLFVQSSSIQSWFVELAREIGAYSCEIDFEGPKTLLFLDGEEMRVSADEDEQWPHSLLMRYRSQHPESDAARKAYLCDCLDEDSSHHERMEVQLCLRHENSGVRARALQSLTCLNEETALELIEPATNDVDWRVRATSAVLLGDYKIQSGIQRLEQMLLDNHPEVRIAATLALGQFPQSFEILLRVLLSTPPTTQNLGLIKAALTSVARTTFGPRTMEALELALARPDFPFKQVAAEKLNMFRRRASP